VPVRRLHNRHELTKFGLSIHSFTQTEKIESNCEIAAFIVEWTLSESQDQQPTRENAPTQSLDNGSLLTEQSETSLEISQKQL
jgi:hypothetical protein